MRTLQQDRPGRERIIRGTVTSTGGFAGGVGFIVTKTGTGAYTVRYLEPFGAPPSPVVTPLASVNYGVNVATSDGYSFSVATFVTNTLAAADAGFIFTVQGISR